MPRLNDTKAIVDTPLKDGWTGLCEGSCYPTRGVNPTKPLRSPAGERGNRKTDPDAGEAVVARRAVAGEFRNTYDYETNDMVGRARPHPDAGNESLRGAAMYLGKRIAPSSSVMAGKHRK